MTTRDDKPELAEVELDALFEAQRRVVSEPSADFMARIAADAAAAAAQMGAPAQTETLPERTSLWAWLGAALAAIPAQVALPGGAVAAGLVGLWIGVAAPQGVPDPALLLSGSAATDSLGLVLGDTWFALDALDESLWEDG